jgi:hypothetical protein
VLPAGLDLGSSRYRNRNTSRHRNLLQLHRDIKHRQRGTGRDISWISNNNVHRNEKGIGMVASGGRGMEGSKWENSFIKHNIPRNVNAAFGHIEAIENLMHIAIVQEHTPSGAHLKFVIIIWEQIRPTSTAKDMEARAIRSGT